jgi:hypothetical protein
MNSIHTQVKQKCIRNTHKEFKVARSKKVSLTEILFLPKISINPHTSFAAMAHLAEGVCINAILVLKVENSLICLVGTRTPTMSKMECQLVLALKTLIRI